MKKLNTLLLIMAILTLTACGPRTEPAEEVHSPEIAADLFTFQHDSYTAFFNNLRTLCEQSFEGKQIYMQEGRESWEDKRMVMHVTVCEDYVIHIPFHLNEDRSRTWMFFNENGNLRFRHDHRHEDGTPEEVTMYGGYAEPERGTAYKQIFPADDYTIELIPISVDSEWVVEFKDDMSIFSYQLHHEGELLFEAQFDLTQPL
ncbi:MAG: hypothetical protein EA393_04365 [Bacteroidetes bacterium]|nr:MAG: hypothetical protein EA393_04365 [Bacteroidota bacterium]